MNKNTNRGSSYRIRGIMLICVAGLMLLLFITALILVKRDPFNWGGAQIVSGLLFLFAGIPCALGGRYMVKNSEWDDIWQTSNEAKAPELIKKVSKINDETKLIETGKTAALEQVADAAFSRVANQQALGDVVRSSNCSYDRRRIAMRYLTDEDQLAQVVKSRMLSTAASNLIKSDALNKLNDPAKISAFATDLSIAEGLRKTSYERLRTVTEQQGGNVTAVDEMVAKDRTMIPEMRAAAYMHLQSAGREGHRMLAQDQSMPLETRAKAYEWIGDKEKAAQMKRKADQNRFFHPKNGTSKNEQREAGKRIIGTGDEKWIETNVREAMKYSRKGEQVYMDFLVDAAEQYPDIIRKMWPQLTRWAHADATNHDDKHYDWGHNDWVSRNSYDRGKHYDFMNSSDCTHSDQRNEQVHTDRANRDYLDRFPPAVRTDGNERS